MGMKRLQIMIEQDLDAAVQRKAEEEGISKAAVIRRCVREGLLPVPPLQDDSLWKLMTIDDGGWDPDEHIDDVIYR